MGVQSVGHTEKRLNQADSAWHRGWDGKSEKNKDTQTANNRIQKILWQKDQEPMNFLFLTKKGGSGAGEESLVSGDYRFESWFREDPGEEMATHSRPAFLPQGIHRQKPQAFSQPWGHKNSLARQPATALAHACQQCLCLFTKHGTCSQTLTLFCSNPMLVFV